MSNFENLTKGYGDAKLAILKMLWAGDWVLGDSVRDAIGQSYYDRRIRELRDEDGWQIETGWAENDSGVKRSAYRLVSQIRGKGIKRKGISAQDRKFVLNRDNFVCQLCGADLQNGNNNPQIDHKIPLIRDGASEPINYQAVCTNCNVVKRGICKSCTLPTCENCYLAFPEKGAKNLLINLTEVESRFLTETANRLGLSRRETLRNIVSAALNEPFEE